MSDSMLLVLMSLLSDMSNMKYELDDVKADLLCKTHESNFLRNDLINTFCGVR